MRVSVVQMNQGSDKAANLAQARGLVEAAVAADRPDLVSLPETWTNLGGGRQTIVSIQGQARHFLRR